MTQPLDSTLREHAASVFAWWREAGVDWLVDEVPRQWLHAGAHAREGASAAGSADAGHGAVAAATSPPIRPAAMPATLAAYIDWLLTDTSIFGAHPVRQRLQPEGDPASDLMIVADCPETGDAISGRLLTGPAGALLDKMLHAIGHDRPSIYLATLVPTRPPGGMVANAIADAMAAPIRHHVALVQPAKLWLMGEAASRAMLGMSVQEATGKLHTINHQAGTTAAIATLHPRVLLAEPKAKARVWGDMQRLMGMAN